MAFKCSIYDKRNSVCREYPSAEDSYVFESCQYIKNGKVTSSDLSEREQQKYCMECGLCCFLNYQTMNDKFITVDMESEWKKCGKCKYLVEGIG